MAIKAIEDFVQKDSFYIKIRHNPIIDITNAVFTVTLCKTENSTPTLLKIWDVSTTNDALNGNSVNGITNIQITSTDTDIDPGEYYLSIKRTLDLETVTLVRTNKNKLAKVEVFKNMADN